VPAPAPKIDLRLGDVAMSALLDLGRTCARLYNSRQTSSKR